MPQFVANSKSSFILNARNINKKSAGFYAVDLAATQFANYIIKVLDPNAIQKNLLVQGSIESKEPMYDDV
jgi:hypothetical protein